MKNNKHDPRVDHLNFWGLTYKLYYQKEYKFKSYFIFIFSGFNLN